MRITILTQYYAPEIGAPQTRLRETAARLTERGHRVRVITAAPHYPVGRVFERYSAARPTRELVDRIPVLRMPSIPRPNRSFVDRTVDQGSLALSVLAAAPWIRWAEVFVVESPPLFLAGAAVVLRRLAARPFVLHVADPWPDFPIAMGVLEQPLARRAAFALESLAYREAALITTVTPAIVRLLDAKAAAQDKVRLLPNGVDVSRFEPSVDRAAARRALGWDEHSFTVVYAGSVGLAQGLGTLVRAAGMLPTGGLAIHVVGGGFDEQQLRERARREATRTIRFHPAMAADRIPMVLAAADAILVMLRAGPLYEASLPTKLVEGLAAARPLVVSAAGDAATLVEQSGAGWVAAPEDANALAEAILRARDATDRDARGRAGRRLAETQFDRGSITDRLIGYLEEAVAIR